MASAIEVVGQIESIAVAQIALDAEIGLLRIRVDKILRLRITKRLKAERQERRRSRIRAQI